MKKLLSAAAIFFYSVTSYSQIQFNNLTKEDIENVTREFGANFHHTVIAAPETDDSWGLEIGIIAGKTATPELEKIVEKSGGDGSDVKNLYHLGAMARIHFPLELFIEGSFLPEQEIDSFSVKNTSYGAGWNAGGFFNFPVDIAFGVSRANSELSFTQISPMPSTIKLETRSMNYWIGIGRTFGFISPYFKYGKTTIEGDLSGSATLFGYTASSSESVEGISGNFITLGTNLEFGTLKLGVEASKIMDVQRVSGKISFDF